MHIDTHHRAILAEHKKQHYDYYYIYVGTQGLLC